MTAPIPSSSSTALKSFEISNDVQILEQDKIFRYDAEEQRSIQNVRPWKTEPRYFTKVRVSCVALIKMVMHARSGGQYEIMGLMQGKIDGDTFVVMDSFALPVQGTETRVNAANEANEYMVEFLERSKNVGRLENVVGWYHSHPGYGCWLSGIDVNTQMTNQAFQDPFVAIVIDPNRTISAGKVDIGAFRTYPANYTPPNAGTEDGYQSIPLAKIEDFGAHANSYYALEVEHFKGSHETRVLELLWDKYWVMTLSQSPLISNRAYVTSEISDLAEKLSRTEHTINQRCHLASHAPLAALNYIKSTNGGKLPGLSNSMTIAPTRGEDLNEREGANSSVGGNGSDDRIVTALAKLRRNVVKVDGEEKAGLVRHIIKEAIFSSREAGKAVEFPDL